MCEENIDKNDGFYSTSDLGVCCALVCLGRRIGDITQNADKDKLIYRFLSDPLLHTTIEQYWNDILRVNPHRFFKTLRYIESLLHTSHEDIWTH